MSNNSNGEQKTFRFERKFTLDGVAFLGGLIGALLYIGHLDQKITQLQKDSDSHSEKLESVSQSVESVKSDVAVLSAVVVERTGKPLK